jgi:hypothetical protein
MPSHHGGNMGESGCNCFLVASMVGAQPASPVRWLHVIDNGIDRLLEVIGGSHVHVRACGGLCGEVSSTRGVVIASPGLPQA